MSLVVSIVAILLMIVLHEWGHFIAGRICKIPIYEFSIGMGPVLWQRQGKKETKWSIRAFPVGGYCAFDDLENMSDTTNGVLDLALDKLPCHQRIFIAAAGPAMNIFTALIVTFFMLLFAGNQYISTQVVDILPNSPAEKVFEVGDDIQSINGVQFNGDGDKMTDVVSKYTEDGNPLHVVVERNGKTKDFDIRPEFDKESNRYLMGVTKGYGYSPMIIQEAIPASFKTTFGYLMSTIDGIVGIFSGKYAVKDLSSIVGAVAVMKKFATLNHILDFFTICCLISVNLGFMNLLPIPALDGSKIVLAIWEKIIGRHVNQDILAKVTVIGFSTIMILGLLLMLNDIIKIIN